MKITKITHNLLLLSEKNLKPILFVFSYLGWAHVVCALYIPEVRFGDVSTMEPIIFSSVPHERFLKVSKQI